MLCCLVYPKPTLNQCGLATWFTQQSLSPFRLCQESLNLPGSVLHPGVPQRFFVRLPDADWPDGGRCCFQLLPQLNCEPVPVGVFFGVVNSNIITQFESACLESIHCGFLVILCDLLVKGPKINMPLYSYSWRWKSCWLAFPVLNCPGTDTRNITPELYVVVKCVNKKTIPTKNIKVFPILVWERSGCECPVLKAGTFPITVVRKKTRWLAEVTWRDDLFLVKASDW